VPAEIGRERSIDAPPVIVAHRRERLGRAVLKHFEIAADLAPAVVEDCDLEPAVSPQRFKQGRQLGRGRIAVDAEIQRIESWEMNQRRDGVLLTGQDREHDRSTEETDAFCLGDGCRVDAKPGVVRDDVSAPEVGLTHVPAGRKKDAVRHDRVNLAVGIRFAHDFVIVVGQERPIIKLDRRPRRSFDQADQQQQIQDEPTHLVDGAFDSLWGADRLRHWVSGLGEQGHRAGREMRYYKYDHHWTP
jgi:hypothetical protein